MGALMRAFDWSQTPIGPVSNWPQSLKTAVRIILTSRYAMFVWWGGELVNLYNDPYRAFLGIKHPAALGRSARQVWAEIWDQIGPRTEAVLLRGESTYDEALLLLMERHGYLEETYFTFSYSPLPDDKGNVGGLFCAVTEETQRVIGERRLALLREIAAATAEARTPLQVCQSASQSLSKARRDLPFSLIYLLEADGRTLKRVGEAGTAGNHPAAPDAVTLDEDAESVLPFRRVMESGEAVLIENLSDRIADVPTGEWSRGPECAILAPIAQQGQTRPAGILVAGLNPYRKFDDEFRGFVSLLSNQIAAAVANAVAYETERQRAEALAELDRAKTLFFSNVSHEFRTPLTLMLGPLEEVLPEARERLSPERHEQLTVARRNALRLLKLVNTLLDFSRIEAGRVQAVYEPTDLATLTAEIASVFRSAMDKAGLRFSVECEPIGEPVYIDRDMWEKVVLNLLSNAFKFTFEGEVALTLRAADSSVQLAVRDTGVGIPADELHRVFERFHRIESTRARTYEGTGIGLALVQELVRLHGGTVRVDSLLGRGSTFTVSIPHGKAHLPAKRIQTRRGLASAAISPETYVDEAQRWLPQQSGAAVYEPIPPRLSPVAAVPGVSEAVERELIVLADDNADMRQYLGELLRDEYRVHAVSDGLQAVEATRQLHPALVLADVMMPGLDGFGVLHAIRNDSTLNSTPVILLSARAGEESQVEGLQAGADDYLVKPFTARELRARVATHLKMAKLRREAAEREARLDASERKREQEALRRSEEEFRALANAMPQLVWMANPDGWIFWYNHRWYEYTGTTPEKMEGWGWQSVHDPAVLPKVLEGWRESVSSGEAFEMTFPLRGRDGVLRPFLTRALPVRDPQGKVMRWFGTNTDISAEVRIQEELRDHQERLRSALVASQRLAAIVESSDDAIVSKDLNGIVTSWNPSAERMFGYTAREMIGQPITTIIPPELQDDEWRILETIARGERVEHFETVRRTKNGEQIEVSLTISPVRNEDGKIIGAAKIARDITQQKKAERALRTAERLASVGRLAATVAHEINNPLEAVTNLIYLAKESAIRNDVREYLAGAEEELDRISHLTKQTLGFYRETKGVNAMKLGAIVDLLIPVFGSRTRNKAIEIHPEIKQDPEIYAVPSEMRQLVANLLSNSIDAVDGGGRIRIRISAAMEKNGEGRSGVRLTVADSGPGIPLALRSKLFEPFFTTKREVGTGLGLWVCKSIVDKHRGSIRVKSNSARGRSWTAFSVFLPLNPEQSNAESLREAV